MLREENELIIRIFYKLYDSYINMIVVKIIIYIVWKFEY